MRDGWSVRDLKAQVMQCMLRVETIQDAVALIGHPEVNVYAISSSAALIRSIAASIWCRSPVRRARSSISRTSSSARTSGGPGGRGEAVMDAMLGRNHGGKQTPLADR